MNSSKIKRSREKWKQKAIKKTKEAKALRKEKKRLEQSRTNWKEKYKQVQLASRQRACCLQSKDISRHSYNSLLIVICLSLKLYAQQSVRGISKSVGIWIVALGLEGKAPSHTTIHSWIRKSGYYHLKHAEDSSGAQWVLLLDESVCMGREKLLLIMGVDIRHVHQGNISFTNSSCLYVSCSNSWKAEQIAQVLKSLKQQLCGKVRFAVTDRGNNINKALKLSAIPYIHDLTHEMALYLAHLYEQAKDFKAYMQWTALLRKKLVLSKWAHLMPPAQRSKARFHNIEPLYKWGKAIEEKLPQWQGQDRCLYEQFKNITEFKSLLQEFASLLTVIKALKTLTTTSGIRRALLADIYQLLKGLKHGRPAMFAQKMRSYFQQSWLALNKENIVICCSDLIESAFGKFKLMMSANQWSGITDLALAIPAFMGQVWDQDQVKMAFEQVKVKDYKHWTEQNMQDALLKKRRQAFQNAGQKYSPF